MKVYGVRECFYTLQGEGGNAGRAAVFLRFNACNLWSGRAQHRERDAIRNRAACPMWCDTDFAGGSRLTLDALLETIAAARRHPCELLVATGGEPLLQLDAALVAEVHRMGMAVAIETNGTIEAVPAGVDWVCVSPKRRVDEVRLRHGDELKVVFPAYHPLDYAELAPRFAQLYVSPEAPPAPVAFTITSNMAAAARFCMEHPPWRLSIQAHKILSLP